MSLSTRAGPKFTKIVYIVERKGGLKQGQKGKFVNSWGRGSGHQKQ